MNANTLIPTLSLALAMSVAAAALNSSVVAPVNPASPVARSELAEVPRVVVTAHRAVAIARVVVIGHRPGRVQALAAARP